MPSEGFESAIPASAGPQTYALDRVATGIGTAQALLIQKIFLPPLSQVIR
jgi:hypothetical protein